MTHKASQDRCPTVPPLRVWDMGQALCPAVPVRVGQVGTDGTAAGRGGPHPRNEAGASTPPYLAIVAKSKNFDELQHGGVDPISQCGSSRHAAQPFLSVTPRLGDSHGRTRP